MNAQYQTSCPSVSVSGSYAGAGNLQTCGPSQNTHGAIDSIFDEEGPGKNFIRLEIGLQ